MPAGFGALRDDHVDPGLLECDRLLDRSSPSRSGRRPTRAPRRAAGCPKVKLRTGTAPRRPPRAGRRAGARWTAAACRAGRRAARARAGGGGAPSRPPRSPPGSVRRPVLPGEEVDAERRRSALRTAPIASRSVVRPHRRGAQRAQAAGLAHRRDELRRGRARHRRLDDRQRDPEPLGHRSGRPARHGRHPTTSRSLGTELSTS